MREYESKEEWTSVRVNLFLRLCKIAWLFFFLCVPAVFSIVNKVGDRFNFYGTFVFVSVIPGFKCGLWLWEFLPIASHWHRIIKWMQTKMNKINGRRESMIYFRYRTKWKSRSAKHLRPSIINMLLLIFSLSIRFIVVFKKCKTLLLRV